MKPVERLFLDFCADAYFAARLSGLSPDAAARVVSEVVTDKIRNLNRNRKEPDMRVSETYGGNALTAEDMPDGGMKATISRVTMKSFDDGKDKFVLHFEETTKTLIVNKTNADTITDLYGDDTDFWENQQIVMFRTKVMFNGKSVSAIRIRAPKPTTPQKPAGKRPVVTQEDADQLDGDQDIPF